MTAQAFPVRFAETVNRFGSPRLERARVSESGGEPVLVTLGDRCLAGRALARRVTRRGRQTLVSVHGRLTWVATSRVQHLHDPAA